jgi:hypothetical protein
MKKQVSFVLCLVLLFVSYASANYSNTVIADNPIYYNSFNGGYDAGVNGYIAEVGNVMNGANMDSTGISGGCINTATAGHGSVGIAQAGAFTYEIWAKSDTSTYSGNILTCNPYQSPFGVLLVSNGSNNKLDVHVGWGAWYQGTVAVTDPTQWHQFVITFDNAAAAGGTSTGRFYIDGQMVIENIGGGLALGSTSADAMAIGGSDWFGMPNFSGSIDELSVY